jgi:hypothetical protein
MSRMNPMGGRRSDKRTIARVNCVIKAIAITR